MKKVLIVEDDSEIRELLVMLMELEGYQVSSLNNGIDVISNVSFDKPDLILLDVMLGDSDGRDVCKDLKQSATTQNIPIIIVSGTHGWHTAHEKKCGADDYVSKPFDISYLASRVSKFISQ
jgi:DNA-binding response OmpR family regulator